VKDEDKSARRKLQLGDPSDPRINNTLRYALEGAKVLGSGKISLPALSNKSIG
jgi:hypothetical protein